MPIHDQAAAKKSRVEDIAALLNDLQSAISMLRQAGLIEEVKPLLATLLDLRKSLARIKVDDDGSVVMVH